MISQFGFRGMALAGVLALGLAGSALAGEATRIVSVGGAVTEIVFALGEQDRLVARDTTSNYPPEVERLPDVGYIRRLSPEGVLSVGPDMIVAEEGAGPLEAVELMEEAAVPWITIPGGYTKEAVLEKVAAVSEALNVPEKGAALAAQLDTEIDAAIEAVGEGSGRKVLFILSAAGGRLMAAGQHSSVDAMIALAGGVNAMQGFHGYKQVTDETVAESGAEVILMMDRVGNHAATDQQILAMPAIAATPAGQSATVRRMDGMLLTGFSVRTAQAITQLAAMLEEAD